MKPILFNTEMVRAILEGHKTVTRRVVKPQPKGAHTVLDHDDYEHTVDMLCGNGGEGGVFLDWAETIKSPCWPGDILWVRETFIKKPNGEYLYKADDETVFPFLGWRPSIHMPREAARIFLRVTNVQAERLQEVDDAGVVAEGLEIGCYFDELWNRTIKPKDRPTYGWEANPWVWVIEFERISKEEAMK